MSAFDIVIIGAGAAGIGAASCLAETNRAILVLEARDRIGGRAHTVTTAWGDSVDLGCGWLHSADQNPLAQLFASKGYAIDRTRPRWDEQDGERGFPRDEQTAFADAFDAFEQRLADAAERNEEGQASRYFEECGRWNPLMNAVSSYYNGTEFDRVSVLDYAAYVDTGTNWRLPGGYGAALEALMPPMPLKLNCRVHRVRDAAGGLVLETSMGEVEARCAILTVPTPVIADGRIELPKRLSSKREAAAGVPLGLANKAFLKPRRPEDFSVEGHLFGKTDTEATASYNLRPFGRGLIEVFVGGRHAADLEREGPGAIMQFAVEELRGLYGSDPIRGMEGVIETAWLHDEFSSGSYSHALPGHAAARRLLARADDDRLFWAGEATHGEAFSTAHGAWESGRRAADEALRVFATTKN